MEDGTIVLKGLPLNVGKSVEVIVLKPSSQSVDLDSVKPNLDKWQSLKGSVTRYENPFETATPLED